MVEAADTHNQVKEYYGQTLQTINDLRTPSCCSVEAMPEYIKAILCDIDDEIQEKFYGCGSSIPLELTGCTVLDLGCGSGRDVYLMSKLVGPEGRVIGVDMTEEQLEVAQRHIDTQTERFGYATPNVEFHLGCIENLREMGIADESVDVVISNCVINLSPNKRRVFAEIFRVLKPGGELYFSDIFSGQRIPDALAADPLLVGECLGGAMYTEDFRRTMMSVGFIEQLKMSMRRVSLDDPEIHEKAGRIDFYSITVRAFKIDGLEDQCEDYGQVVMYRGTLPESPHTFVLDDHHTFIAGKPYTVCGNIASMLSETRYAKHFQVTGDRSVHYGLFDCGHAVDDMHEYSPSSCC